MSERFLEGFVVDLDALAALIGTPKLAAKAIRKKLGKKAILRDIEMTLGYDADSDDDSIVNSDRGVRAAGAKIVDAALDMLAAGKPSRSADRYTMTRITPLVLHAYATPLGTIECIPHISSDSFGLMNPVFKALGMPILAKEYGHALLPWPYKTAAEVGWPIITVAGKTVYAWQRELRSDWKKLLPLPDKVFKDKTYGLDSDADMLREEIPGVLATLTSWVDKAVKKKAGLVIILDGDQ
jgi:hypothetical protein